jgi:hypothetical protein
LDRTLEQLLRDRVPLRAENVSFAVPDDAFRGQLPAGLTVNLYLYDIRENHDLRSPEWTLERQPDGTTVKRRPRARIDLFYMITTWSRAQPQPDVLAEHALLSRILRTLLRYPTIPAELLQGALIGQEPPLPTLVAQPDGMRNPAEFWGALRQPPRPGLHLMVTIAMEPTALTDEPVSLMPVVSLELGLGQEGGRIYQMGVRPPLPQRYPRGARLRRMTVEAAPAAQLQTAVFAARLAVRIIQVNSVPPHEWVLIDDGANSEFVRVGEVAGPGAQDVAVMPPLRFAHDPTAAAIPLRRVTAPDPDVIEASLRNPANVGANALRVAAAGNIVAGNAVLISDAEKTEMATVTNVVPAGTDLDIQVSPTLRFAHAANRNLYRRTIEAAPANPATATRLAQPAAQSGNLITLDNNVAIGTVLMVGAGPNVEFCRLNADAVAGNAVAVTPSLRNNHPANTPLRRLTEAEVIGQLDVTAPSDSEEVVMVADSLALVSAGEVLQLDDPQQPALAPSPFQVTSVVEKPSAMQGAPEEFFVIGGWVTDNAAPPNPVVGARVTLTEPRLTATTDVEGRFTFVNLARGNYTLQVTAAGFQAQVKPVQAPARNVNEYRVTLNP